MNLVLRKTNLGRENDYVICMDRKAIGRIMQEQRANNTVVWTWSLTGFFTPQRAWMRGHQPSLEEAKTASRTAIEHLSASGVEVAPWVSSV